MFKKSFGKRGSEVIQNLIVIAIMGALAITALTAIANSLKSKNNDVLQTIDAELDQAQNGALDNND
jgi:type II secretory pathway pseudopilin PulG